MAFVTRQFTYFQYFFIAARNNICIEPCILGFQVILTEKCPHKYRNGIKTNILKIMPRLSKYEYLVKMSSL